MPDEEVLVTIRLPAHIAKDASRARVASFLGLNISDLNESFGIVPLERAAGLFSLMVRTEILGNLSNDVRKLIEGPYSNPNIAPFGPPE